MVLKSRGPTRGDLAALGGGGVGEVGGHRGNTATRGWSRQVTLNHVGYAGDTEGGEITGDSCPS